ncbi:error-prone DNA polymerase [Engelhardtia mirabilis]|uniref:Error-prone DNA polymerase n=1 Tax=Engelhardtia mirabilis TaxID=2528011 RepID=A0A518BFZ1_9BACT|nr:Error-prone DNA polymerase [Planctomycetes bacterium Pla133]QDV00226.1 Error-prone DNA polymerase [Planctomycetes bacterium Pla86]
MPPEQPAPKLVQHPRQRFREGSERVALGARRRAARAYAELEVSSNFTFLAGASHPEELVQRASELGQAAIGITDTNSLAGVVRGHVAAKELGFAYRVGCRLTFDRDGDPDLAPDGPGDRPASVLVYPTDLASYGSLCRLLTLGKRRATKGSCSLGRADLMDHACGLLAICVPPTVAGHAQPPDAAFARLVTDLREAFDDDRLSIAARALYGPDDRHHLARLARLSERLAVPLVATGDVHYHARERRELQDVLTCIRHGCTLDAAGLRLFPNAERHLKPPEAMGRLFEPYPQALDRSLEIAERAGGFSLDQLSYDYPHEVVDEGCTPMQSLIARTFEGAAERYPGGLPDKVRANIEHEFELIRDLGYAPYFLTVYDLVRFARSRGILCQGRGAAANSAVCYCLGVTSVDPARIDLLFERFVSKERGEPPDIDVDFEHERREEVIQYLYAKYGRERCGLTAVVITYRSRSAIREVGKVVGLSLDLIDRLAKDVDWWHEEVGREERVRAMGLDPAEPTLRRTFQLVGELLGFPRHLSQHVGGFVMTEGLLSELVPIENAAMEDRTVIEWDKDDIEALGILKVDVLALGMLTCVQKAFDLVDAAGGSARAGRPLALHTVPAEDPEVYDMVCAADTVGVFQIESRAQMTMLPRLRPRCFYDLVIEVAIVRPGPIQGDMVHPYLRRRSGEEPIEYPGPEVERVLGKTLGVPLFQEQAMAMAMVAGGFTPGEADRLRRAMAAWKRKTTKLEEMTAKLKVNLLANGYGADFAERFIRQLHGFSEYGFPESHAASFALIVYVSSWLKRWHPAAFAAALINSQPMGFYAPAQIVTDAREHGVDVRPVDVSFSGVDCRLEGEEPGTPADERRGGSAVRLGLRLVRGLNSADAERIERAVTRRRAARSLEHAAVPFASIEELWRESGASATGLRQLAYADAFASLGLDRQRALWAVRALDERAHDTGGGAPTLWDVYEQEALVDSPSASAAPIASDGSDGADPLLPEVGPLDRVLHDYSALGLSLASHPMAFLREELATQGVIATAELADEERLAHGTPCSVAGLVLVRQRPATASGVVFITLEDEGGVANLIVRPKVFEANRAAARHGTVILARGTVERAGSVVHVLAKELECLDDRLMALASQSRDFH